MTTRIIFKVNFKQLLSSISSTADIDKLRQITETNDTTTFNFQPTQKQFCRFIKQKGFSDIEEYVKIRD